MTVEAYYMILGAVLSVGGGIIGAIVTAWINARWGRYNHMQELIAQKKIENNQHAYAYAKNIEALLIQGTMEQVKEEIEKHSEWFFSNAIFLPTDFAEKWLTLRSGVSVVLLHQKTLGISTAPEQLTAEMENLSVLAKELLD